MRLPTNQPNSRVRRERDRRALSRLALLLFCALVLAGGFVFAARQHFAAVQYGYETESLRVERQQLLREQQQLFLQKEQASAPGRLESAARALGLKPIVAGQVGTSSSKQSTQPSTSAIATASTALRR
jgi:cell division protein FtsL